jgi:hypothetical protein
MPGGYMCQYDMYIMKKQTKGHGPEINSSRKDLAESRGGHHLLL